MSWAPNQKITAAGGIGVPLSIVLAWALSQGGINMPPEVATAVGALISTALGYFVPERKVPQNA